MTEVCKRWVSGHANKRNETALDYSFNEIT